MTKSLVMAMLRSLEQWEISSRVHSLSLPLSFSAHVSLALSDSPRDDMMDVLTYTGIF
jgi:hypothetical protein